MKITLTVKELAVFAGISKEIYELCGSDLYKDDTVQSMMSKLFIEYCHKKDNGLYSIGLDKKMNIVIKVNEDAAADIMEVIADLAKGLIPLVKVYIETVTSSSEKISAVLKKYTKDEKKEKTKKEEESAAKSVVHGVAVIIGGEEENQKEEKIIKNTSEEDSKSATRTKNVENTEKKTIYKNEKIKAHFICPNCGRNCLCSIPKSKENIKTIVCNDCGNEMIRFR